MTGPPFRLNSLDHVVLRVRDLPRAVAFYRDVLGCAVEREQREIGLTQLRAGAALIDLLPVDGVLGRMGGAPPGAEARNMDHFALTITPFDESALRAHLAIHDVAVEASGQRYGAEGEGPSIYIRDPDGNTVELKGQASKVQ
jgi:catechol 2,3-dioxygenase-like lactoylglutathione lyase family enzyme